MPMPMSSPPSPPAHRAIRRCAHAFRVLSRAWKRSIGHQRNRIQRHPDGVKHGGHAYARSIKQQQARRCQHRQGDRQGHGHSRRVAATRSEARRQDALLPLATDADRPAMFRPLAGAKCEMQKAAESSHTNAVNQASTSANGTGLPCSVRAATGLVMQTTRSATISAAGGVDLRECDARWSRRKERRKVAKEVPRPVPMPILSSGRCAPIHHRRLATRVRGGPRQPDRKSHGHRREQAERQQAPRCRQRTSR